MDLKNSIEQFERAKQSIASGVNSPVRAFKSVKSNPVFFASAKGAYITDIDGNNYVDFVSSWGPMILGHANERVVEEITKADSNGTSYGAPTIQETIMAEQIVKMIPSIEIVRMVNSGTEATMSALRLARAFTNREMVIKFEGCYHGHADGFLIKAGSGALTLGVPDSAGVTQGTAKDTLTAEYNNIESVKNLFEQYHGKIAAVILEPVAGNMGVVLPDINFLKELRKITTDNKTLLIFDEVITGFRLSKGGAQEYYDIMPDITTLGKIIGGGLPVGAYGGSKEIMDLLAPNGPVYQAGTLSGNPLAMAAGLETLLIIEEDEQFYSNLNSNAEYFENGLKTNLKNAGVNAVINRVGSMMTMFFTDEKEVKNYNQALKSNTSKYANYFNLSLKSGIYLAPSQYEAAFISAAHTKADIDKVLELNYLSLKQL